eukprot:TRINITY_DN30142_c0_g1_i1.p1 TRINITY_DN30142_c0_g1~~TRINITY_DN30142_c0_g1_i1.p1  ORF type:complete len:976 (+),score=142.76 TRINITY_DN30142_c0_g1_i1:26-2929(+)
MDRKTGKARRKPRSSKRKDDAVDDDDTPSQPRFGLHWYIISISIVLVTCISFLNFLALPDVRAHSLLSAVLIRRRAAISGDPHSDPSLDSLGGLSDEERVALIKAAEEALEAPLPAVVPVASGLRGSYGAYVPPRELAQQPSETYKTPLQDRTRPSSDSSPASALRARSRAAMLGDIQQGVSVHPASVKGGVATFSGDSWLELSGAVDFDELTFTAWIYLPKVSELAFPASSESMKTIASTKISGCSSSTKGWAFFVHEWSTLNRQLRLSWSDSQSGCHEIFSDTTLVPWDKWVLVGFSLSRSENRASIVIDKHLIVDTNLGLGKYVLQGKSLALSSAQISTRSIADSGQLRLGAHAVQPNSDYTQSHVFVGFIGDVRVLQTTVDPMKIVPLMHTSTQDLLTGQSKFAPVSSVRLLVQFQTGRMPTDFINGVSVRFGQTNSFQPRGPDGPMHSPVPLLPLDDKLVHPMLQDGSFAAAELPKRPELDPAALRATWPKEWLSRFTDSELMQSQSEVNPWAEEVRQAMKHSWDGYRARAWGHDDIQPVRGAPKDWCRMAVTMLDALSTLWVMGLHAEFEAAAAWLQSNPMPTEGSHGQHSLFEIIIRAFASLLSAYSLSGKAVFLDTAKSLGEKLLGAFNTPTGIPRSTIDVGTGQTASRSSMPNTVLAEATTLQVEFRYMTHVTGDRRYKEVADKAMNAVLTAAGSKGLVPLYLSGSSPQPQFVGTKMSMGAMGDSYYEYLLKQWIQTGKKEHHLKDAWKRAMDDMMGKMVAKTAGGLQYLAELENGIQKPRMDHLACFVAGMLMLGSRTLPKEEVDPRWEPFAGELTRTCYEMYVRTPTGLSPEYATFNNHEKAGRDMGIPGDAPHNLLRPEAAEAVWYMWYYTGDHKYRKMGYEMFKPFVKYCKVKYGFSAVADVRKNPPPKRDSQESFWLAETLKYFYLIFSPRNTIDLEEWVLNTEAQPLKMWSE